jgi:hypothetical protein
MCDDDTKAVVLTAVAGLGYPVKDVSICQFRLSCNPPPVDRTCPMPGLLATAYVSFVGTDKIAILNMQYHSVVCFSAPPAPGQQKIRTAALAPFLAAVQVENQADRALAKKYPGDLTLADTQAFYRATGLIDGAFIESLRAITYPTDTVVAAQRMIAATSSAQALAVTISGDTSLARARADEVAFTTAKSTAALAWADVRDELQLP